LKRARADVAQEEDNPEARESKRRALHNIDAALRATDRALYDAEHNK
jgi:hypothetical protein